MDDEILRTALAPSEQCLSVEQVGRYADGALETEEQAAAELHMRSCPRCQAELALLQAVMSETLRDAEADVVRDGMVRLEQSSTADRVGRRSRSRWFGVGRFPAAAVAAVLLVGIVTGSYYLVVTRKAPGLPGSVTTGDEVTRSLSVRLRGPVGDQQEAPHRLEWFAVDNAVRYRARLMEVDRHEFWSGVTSATGVDLPSSVRASIAPGRTLLWDVTAYDATGAVIAESGPQSFRVVRR